MSLIALVVYILIIGCVLSIVATVPFPGLPPWVRNVASIVIVIFAILWLANHAGIIHTG